MVPTPDGEEAVKPYQIIVLVSITAKKLRELPHDAPRIPAVLDTGHNHNFAIRRGQLERWVPLTLPRTGQIEVGGSIVPLLAANLWIHPNREGTVEPSGESPFMLEAQRRSRRLSTRRRQSRQAPNPGLARDHPKRPQAHDRRCNQGADHGIPLSLNGLRSSPL